MDMELKFISTTKKNDAIHPLPEGRGLLAKKDKNRYRFGGVRYGFRGPSCWQSDFMVPDLPELMTSPRTDT